MFSNVYHMLFGYPVIDYCQISTTTSTRAKDDDTIRTRDDDVDVVDDDVDRSKRRKKTHTILLVNCKP